MPGPNRRSQRSTSMAVALLGRQELGRLAQPLLGERPDGSGEPPVAVVGSAHDPSARRERAEHPRGDREVAAVGLAGGHLQAPGERRDALAQLRGGGRPVVGEGAQHGRGRAGEPPRTVLRDAVALDLLGQAGLQLGGHPPRGTPPHGREQVAREGEDGTAHGELLDDRAVVVQRAVDVLRGRIGAGGDREVDAGRLGRVQADDGLDGLRHRVDAPGQGVAPTQPGPALLVGDVPHVRILAARADNPPAEVRRPGTPARWLA